MDLASETSTYSKWKKRTKPWNLCEVMRRSFSIFYSYLALSANILFESYDEFTHLALEIISTWPFPFVQHIPRGFDLAILRSLREFFVALRDGKNNDSSWKKSIYKEICKLDQDIPQRFQTPDVLEHLDKIIVEWNVFTIFVWRFALITVCVLWRCLVAQLFSPFQNV